MLIRKERIPVMHMLFIGMWPSFLKKIIYRMKGYSIGKKVKLSFGCVVIGKKVRIGDGTRIGFFTIVRGKEITIDRFVKIGAMSVIDTEKIFIDEDARINEQVYIGGMASPSSSFHLGKRAIIMQLSYMNPTMPIYIGDDSGIGGHCLFFTHGSWNSQLEGFPVKFAPITLGKKVWLPWRVFVMPGSEIGDNVVIGANSLINGNIPSNSLAAGSPAKVIRENFPTTPSQEEKRKMIAEMFSDFFNYLGYAGIKSSVTKGNDEFIAEISAGKRNSRIVFSNTGSNLPSANKQTVLVLESGDESAVRAAYKNGFGAVFSISNSLRIGSNDAGEEFAGFFSRYGVRFGRLD